MEKLETICIKYLVERISSDDELLSFCIFFFSIMSAEGLSIEQMGVEYQSRVPLCNSAGYDMYTLENVSMDADRLMERASLEGAGQNRPCYKYCREILGDNDCEICSICPRTGLSYKNDFENEEYALLKYAIGSSSNFITLSNMVDRSKCIFRASTDIVSDLSMPSPVIIPLAKIFFYQIKGSKTFFNKDTMEERLRHDIAESHFWSRVFKLHPQAKDVLTSNDKLREVVYGTFVSNILSAKDINEDGASEIIDRIVKAHGAGRNKTVAKKASKGMENQFDLLDMVREQAEKAESHEADPAEPNAVEGSDTEDSKEQMPVVTDVEPEDKTIYELENEAPSMLVEAENEAQERHIINNSDNDDEPDNAVEAPEPEDNKPMDNERGGLLNIPQVAKSTLEAMPSYREIETVAVKGVLKDGAISVEVVAYKDERYLLIYLYSDRLYIISETGNMQDTLRAILADKRIVIYTWQPYMVYALARLNNITIQNIKSILSIYFEVCVGRKCTGYKCVMQEYVKAVQAMNQLNTGDRQSELYLMYMPYYPLVYQELYRKIPGGKVSMRRIIKDELLGCSYLRERNFNQSDVLFEIDEYGRYIYNQEYDISVKNFGRLLSYGINCIKMSNEDKRELFWKLLYALHGKGYFRKFNLQIVRIGEDSITLFCEEYIYDALKTNIRMFIDKAAQNYSDTSFECLSEHRHLAPEGMEGKMNEIAHPRSMQTAQDMLATIHDSVTVKDERIKIKKRTASGKQKETFPGKKQHR